jgi:hypothetical protein
MTLEGHWVLDEDSGATAYDYSGNGNHGDISGAGPQGTGTVTGPFGNSAYDFDGSNDNIRTVDLVSNGEPRTYSIWINVDVSDESNYIFGRQEATGVTDFFFKETGSNTINLNVYNGSSTRTIESETINTGQWYHIAGTHDSGNANRLYLNGVDQGISTHESDSVSGDIPIGSDNDENNFFDGKLADARVYSRALSPQEVQALYQAGVNSRVTLHDS